MSLYEKIKNEFAVKLPEFDELDTVDVNEYFTQVEKCIAGQSRWKVSRDEMVLGFFSFGKFLMYKDLDHETWPEGKGPQDHSIVQALLSTGFQNDTPLISDDSHIDEILSPQDVNLVLDADSSQTLAILDINSGQNMVIQGPPGTGKSQTITNVIAEAIGLNKKVLFVSEKMSALEVVKRRLDAVGLGDAVLELHSHKTNKRALLEELKRTMSLGKPIVGNINDDIQSLTEMRDRLNAYCEAVNTPILNSSLSPIDAIGLYKGLGDEVTSLPSIDFSEMKGWDMGNFKSNRLRVEELQRRLIEMGVPSENPFWGIKRTVLLPTENEKLKQMLVDVIKAVEMHRANSNELAKQLFLDEPNSNHEVSIICRAALRASEAPKLEGVRIDSGDWQVRRDELKQLISSGVRLTELHNDYNEWLIEAAWEQDVLTERQNYIAYSTKWWRFLSGKFRASKARLAGLCEKPLPKSSEQCISLIDAILDAQKHKKIYNQHEILGAHLFGAQWQKLNSDWDVLSALLGWIVRVYDDVGEGKLPAGLINFLDGNNSKDYREKVEEITKDSDRQVEFVNRVESEFQLALEDSENDNGVIKLSEKDFLFQLNLLARWHDMYDHLGLMVKYNILVGAFKDQGLGFILPHVESWVEASELLLKAFDAAWYGGLIDSAYQERREMRQFDRVSHEYAAEKFRELDKLLLQHNKARLALKHWESIPNISQSSGELAVIKREINKKRKHLSIRSLIEQSGNAIQAMKPVFMMGPLSIANFIPQGSIKFDLVIFDEASQVKPVDAFGAILRSNQAVVVGDSKQLPPTSFFDSLTRETDDDEDDNTTSDMESILGLFSAQNAPERMLKWHYRSRHDSLIAVSNHEFYDDKLVVFPSPGENPEARGLVFNYLPDTYYDRGKTRSNPEEAKHVAEAVMQHAKEFPHLTLGVAAFSTAQRDAIQNQLELLRRRDSSCEDFFNAHPHEPFFVKNLENVQGDERDTIYISIGYGKTKDGYMAMSFGPLNREGGERRMNVLISRAKQTCEVFANFTADDIDLKRTKARGVVVLRNFLAFAKDRIMDTAESTGLETDSPFEDEVIKTISGLGYKVEAQIGVAGFRIDLGIIDEDKPGRYVLGIECDGATYHSARSARDRDRLRQEVLEGLGWKIHRIWSTDWFSYPTRELKRVVESIEKAKIYWSGIDAGDINRAKKHSSSNLNREIKRTKETPESKKDAGIEVYKESNIKISLGNKDLHELSVNKIAGYIKEVVEVESPVHRDVIMQRITNGAGLTRVGNRIRLAVRNGITHAIKNKNIVEEKGFIFNPERSSIIVRDRSNAISIIKKPEMLSPDEISEAVKIIVRRGFSVDKQEAISDGLKLMGIKRVTAGISSIVESVVDNCIADGSLRLEGNNIIFNDI